MIDFFSKSSLEELLRKYKFAFASSFSIGVLISTIPLTLPLIEKYRIKKLIQKEIQSEIEKKEKKCKNENSDYAKFLNLGFPNTANEKLNICMKQK